MGYTVLTYLPNLMNLGLFVAVVMTLSRLYADSEMVIWFSSRVGLGSLLKPLLRFAWLRDDAQPPNEARLITVLGEAGGEPLGQLADVDARLSQRFESRDNVLVSKSFGDSLIYQPYIPEALGDLLLGVKSR